MFKKVIGLIIGLSLLLSGCTKDDNTSLNSSEEAIVLTVMMPDGGRVFKEDNSVVKAIETETDLKLDYTLVPRDQFVNKLSMKVASNEMPDIVRISSFGHFQFANQGVFMDMEKYLEKAENLKKVIPQEAFEMVKYEGKQIAIPYINVPGKILTPVRKDWLDNLGLKIPETTEEFEEMLKQFTLNDPDGDGKNNTYGLGNADLNLIDTFSPLLGAFGALPQQFYLRDGRFYAGSIMHEYREALAYVAGLYQKKYIDPDIFVTKRDQAFQKIVTGQYGTFTGWWSIVPETLNGQLKMNQVNPNASWEIIQPIKGPGGKSGIKSQGIIGGTACVSSKSKNPEAVMKLLDFLASDSGYELSYMGIKGEHYLDFGIRTEEGTKGVNEKWLDVMSQVVNRPDIQLEIQKISAPLSAEYVELAAKTPLYEDIFSGITTNDSQIYLADVKKIEEDRSEERRVGKECRSRWSPYH